MNPHVRAKLPFSNFFIRHGVAWSPVPLIKLWFLSSNQWVTSKVCIGLAVCVAAVVVIHSLSE